MCDNPYCDLGFATQIAPASSDLARAFAGAVLTHLVSGPDRISSRCGEIIFATANAARAPSRPDQAYPTFVVCNAGMACAVLATTIRLTSFARTRGDAFPTAADCSDVTEIGFNG
jgi:hypothetical protein